MTKSTPTNMYENARTWNPYRGCEFDCTYCETSFKRQAKRQKHICEKCYSFDPHEHPERLGKIPNSKIVFISGVGDISFADPAFVRRILGAIRRRNESGRKQTYYCQSKRPEFFQQFLTELPENVILVTTLETNRDDIYQGITEAPTVSERFRQFLRLDYPRKVVTLEPIMDFDLDVLASWIFEIMPEYVWVGYNSKKTPVLTEPSKAKTLQLIRRLERGGIPVKRKTIRESVQIQKGGAPS